MSSTASATSTSSILLPGDPLTPSSRSSSATPSAPKPASLSTFLSPSNTPLSSLATSTVSRPQSPSLPYVGATVLARVTRTSPRQANMDILALTSLPTSISSPASSSTQASSPAPTTTVPLAYSFPAILRHQDIRLTALDQTLLQSCFSPGDIVRAKVISLGDERAYYVSTAGDELGVVLGWTKSGRWSVGRDWRSVVEVVPEGDQGSGLSGARAGGGFGAVEERKVARVV